MRLQKFIEKYNLPLRTTVNCYRGGIIYPNDRLFTNIVDNMPEDTPIKFNKLDDRVEIVLDGIKIYYSQDPYYATAH